MKRLSLSSDYDAAGYMGPIDLGLAVTGLRGGVSVALRHHLILRHSLEPYDDEEYFRTGRFMASVFRDDPKTAARNLVLPLTRVVTMENYDPFAEA